MQLVCRFTADLVASWPVRLPPPIAAVPTAAAAAAAAAPGPRRRGGHLGGGVHLCRAAAAPSLVCGRIRCASPGLGRRLWGRRRRALQRGPSCTVGCAALQCVHAYHAQLKCMRVSSHCRCGGAHQGLPGAGHPHQRVLGGPARPARLHGIPADARPRPAQALPHFNRRGAWADGRLGGEPSILVLAQYRRSAHGAKCRQAGAGAGPGAVPCGVRPPLLSCCHATHRLHSVPLPFLPFKCFTSI